SRALSDGEIAGLAPPPPANAPILHYDMETLLPDGRMKDLIGYANVTTLLTTAPIAGKFGQARHFNAGDRITAFPISVPATDFTRSEERRVGKECRSWYSGFQ